MYVKMFMIYRVLIKIGRCWGMNFTEVQIYFSERKFIKLMVAKFYQGIYCWVALLAFIKYVYKLCYNWI